jgi:hypothetical protein
MDWRVWSEGCAARWRAGTANATLPRIAKRRRTAWPFIVSDLDDENASRNFAAKT